MTRKKDYRLTDAGVKAIAKQSTTTKVSYAEETVQVNLVN